MKTAPSIVIETIDGRAFIGASLKECIEKIRASAWACTEPTLKAYMKNVARRASEWTKSATIRTDTVEAFVADMEAVGLYRVVKTS